VWTLPLVTNAKPKTTDLPYLKRTSRDFELLIHLGRSGTFHYTSPHFLITCKIPTVAYSDLVKMSRPLPTWPMSISNLPTIRPVCWWHSKTTCITTYVYHVSSWLRYRNIIRTAVLLWLVWTDSFLDLSSTIRVKSNICTCKMGGPQSGHFEQLLILFKIYGPILCKSVTTIVQPWHPKAWRTCLVEKWNKALIASIWSYSTQLVSVCNIFVMHKWMGPL